MFSLIISIISIALVAALALAAIYYGGDAFQRGSADAEASTIINQGQQIQAAITMADVDEKYTTTTALADLVGADKYLKEAPKVRGNSWVIDHTDNVVKITGTASNPISEDVCKAIEKKFDGSDAMETAKPAAYQAFGCFGKTDGTATAYYKI